MKDISNVKFGRLTALYPFCFIGCKQRKIGWVCKCDCGNVCYSTSQNIRNGTAPSCGCLSKERAKFIAKRLPPGEAGLNYLYSNYKTRAYKSGREFSLSIDFFKKITSSNCYYCGINPSQVISPNSNNGVGKYQYNGIDRMDNSIGYIESNSLPCCKICNRAKLTSTYEEFSEWIDRIKGKK